MRIAAGVLRANFPAKLSATWSQGSFFFFLSIPFVSTETPAPRCKALLKRLGHKEGLQGEETVTLRTITSMADSAVELDVVTSVVTSDI
jgi:hypothetical protein